MVERPLPPQFIDDDVQMPVRPQGDRQRTGVVQVPQKKEEDLTRWRTLDKPLLVILVMLLATGVVMVFSATFDYSLAEFGSETVLLQNHVRNLVIGTIAMFVFSQLDPRIVRRLAVVIMLMAISFLIAVLLFGDDTFGARRALIDGRFQPGEFSELAIIIYMAAWLGSRNVRVRSLTYGLIPFVVLVGIVTGLVIAQPDLSTALVILLTSGTMFFLAGADMRQITAIGVAFAILAAVALPFLPDYVDDRVDGWIEGISDPTATSYHIFQVRIGLQYGGWAGIGLGESQQKFLALPAPHTDSIFAVIGEELGVVGAGGVIALYIAFAVRGFQIARNATDAFGALMASGITIWIAAKALLNIAVMTALVPPTGLPLPFISFGGSSLVVLMVGIGLLMSIQRQTMLRKNSPERRVSVANYDRGRWNRRSRLPRTRRSRGSTPADA
jgi:cell division protein FtsW